MTDGTIVVTGGNGFVGQHLIAKLERSWPGAKLVVWDLPEVDVTKPDTYRDRLAAQAPQWVVHLAGIAAVGVAEKDPAEAVRVHVEGTRGLLEAARELTPATRCLVVSSADIYGGVVDTPLSELPLGECRPRNAYARSKLQMEEVIEESFNEMVVRVRPFPHIGPGQGLGFVTADFASQVVAIEKGEQEPVIKVGNLEAQRDFTDVRDVVRAYRLLMEQGDAVLGQVFNVASGQAVSVQTILDKLLSMSEVDIDVGVDAEYMRPSDVPVLVGDASKLKGVVDWEPEISLEQSLRDIVEWWRAKN